MSTAHEDGSYTHPYRVSADEAREDGWHAPTEDVPPVYVYAVELTADEARALAWVGARYSSGTVLWAHTHEDEDGDGWVLRMREHEAWEYVRTLDEDEDGELIVPPCVGGTLATKLSDLWERIT